ncbi:unnamed protein product [Darwinula stevensoni]|uniref:Kinesin-like protein n=1 Tax=Darwinula stevensoni TaxID=69355 RepID=A0A7R8XFM6_9CRUS|nr:unnamed protein product [Darwinula stevensoni]CAG0895476.1 unnamed protein product [Darwinula stevensoni]
MFRRRRSGAFGTPKRKNHMSTLGHRPGASRNQTLRGRLGIHNAHAKHPVADSTTSDSNMRVVVRVRPENERELMDARCKNVVKVLDEKVLVFDPDNPDCDDVFAASQMRKPTFRDMLKKQKKNAMYMFDRVYGPEADNMEVFKGTTFELIDSVMEGYNCSVFAYGATGSGKTFTMLGSENCPGIAYYTAKELFRRVEEVRDKLTCDIEVSYLEIYNENIYDLLQKKSGVLQIRDSGKDRFVISSLSCHKPSSPDELLQMLRQGNASRTQHPTDMNAESSRSHAVFLIYIKQRELTSSASSDLKVGMMALIDLAGSEKGSATGYGNARFREGSNINKSLLALGNCINALADGLSHVPYRNSKLTRILKDAIGGNCRSVMVANVSPSSAQYEDSHNTLNYAFRAKNIKTTVRKNVVAMDVHVAEYGRIIDSLNKENATLREENNTLAEKLQAEWELKLQTEKDNSDKLKSEYEVHLKTCQELLEAERKKVVSLEEAQAKWKEESIKMELQVVRLLEKNSVGIQQQDAQMQTEEPVEEMAFDRTVVIECPTIDIPLPSPKPEMRSSEAQTDTPLQEPPCTMKEASPCDALQEAMKLILEEHYEHLSVFRDAKAESCMLQNKLANEEAKLKRLTAIEVQPFRLEKRAAKVTRTLDTLREKINRNELKFLQAKSSLESSQTKYEQLISRIDDHLHELTHAPSCILKLFKTLDKQEDEEKKREDLLKELKEGWEADQILIEESLSLLKYYFLLLKGLDRTTEKEMQAFDRLVAMVEGEPPRVHWAAGEEMVIWEEPNNPEATFVTEPISTVHQASTPLHLSHPPDLSSHFPTPQHNSTFVFDRLSIGGGSATRRNAWNGRGNVVEIGRPSVGARRKLPTPVSYGKRAKDGRPGSVQVQVPRPRALGPANPFKGTNHLQKENRTPWKKREEK